MPQIQFQLFASAFLSLLNKEADLDSDTLKLSLHTSSYTPNLNTHRYVSDLTNEVAAGLGYSTAGATVTGSFALTAANSWASTAATSTAYTVGQVRRPSSGNGYLYRAVVAGTSAGSAPTWPTVVGTTVADGGATWLNIGSAVIVLDLTDATLWTGFGATWRYAVLSDRTPASDATRPLLGLFDAGTSLVGGGGNFDLSTPVEGIYTIPVG